MILSTLQRGIRWETSKKGVFGCSVFQKGLGCFQNCNQTCLPSPLLNDSPHNVSFLFGSHFTQQQASFGCHSLHGRMFYKRRPLQIPKRKPRNYRKKWLEMAPQRRGVCERVFVRSPRKPASGLRKVAYVKLSTGRRILAFIPGVGHNLNVHSVVLVQGGRPTSVAGCYYKCIRGKYDLLPVKGRGRSRSKYGVKLSGDAKERNLRRRYLKTFLYTERDHEAFNQLKWSTWKSSDGTPLLRQIKYNEPVPEPANFNYKWKFIQWMKDNPRSN